MHIGILIYLERCRSRFVLLPITIPPLAGSQNKGPKYDENPINKLSELDTYQSVKIPGSLPLKTTKNGGPVILAWSTSSLDAAC